ncbi:MAG TPA: S-layer homology domain-containing protein, partial [Fervidobacterium sp.]|nr:S-layer homology domain-containing protein [Fervidobacterium sp.]
MRKFLGITLLLVIVVSTAFSATYKDVPANHWAYDAVEQLSKLGILSGMPDGTFQGNQSLTRYQLAVALYRLMTITNDKIAAVEKKIPTTVTTTTPAQTSQIPANIDSQLKSLSDQVLSLSNSDKTINTKIDALSAKVDTVSGKVDLLSQDINNVKTDVSGMQSLYDALVQKVTEL